MTRWAQDLTPDNVNGLMTYDRAVIKLDAGKIRQAHQQLYDR